MGFSSKEGRWRRILRGIKTILFLVHMLVSLLVFSAPVLLAIADTVLPSALLSASLPPSASLSLRSVPSLLRDYDFRYSLVDIPLISIVRSAFIICLYSLCDGPALTRGPYMGITTVCSVMSLAFVSLKASYVFAVNPAAVPDAWEGSGHNRGMEMTLFACSMAMAVAHVAAAYRTSCRERRKLLVFKIDIEAVRVTAGKNGFPRYHHKVLQEQWTR